MRKPPLPVRSVTVLHWRHGEPATKQECQPSPACLGTKGEVLTSGKPPLASPRVPGNRPSEPALTGNKKSEEKENEHVEAFRRVEE
ncbi:MAG: hypothetical protein AW09_000290 [Candidatus Accumulibacter phosphatis]|uniref:Uncharacterized protein n=1 Tax=Candidatus Accumulibacter phosphatis TaxID=327160 RepID=A0A080LZW3_9PROT|nr:MAG: hypothetical protein AW09_000290 [Candidatus Accumulibacter phosphatis]